MSLQRIKVWADGRTEPAIESGTAVILIQNREVEVGKITLEEDDYGSISIEHPINFDELNQEALDAVKQQPELLESQTSVIVICPLPIASKMCWSE